ncbi:SET domain-containing protein [Parahaliea maris]|uniref:SET domain-containing protein n=1 Tax=Parahaliea maris TaxID=2716870 RepID=A0A5C9A4R3_9GAMM|nr:SET domain-containing protein [Parahaliea maris]TXS95865.1 SET domain-containing protein [Parahaliea maris]
MKDKLVVRNSHIHGKGLFTTVGIRKGTVLGYCEREPVKKPNDYTLWIDDKDLYEVTCCLKYINHAASPNVAYYDDFSVVALRNIKKGEELTHHYGEEWE